jgi:hypothetical protein
MTVVVVSPEPGAKSGSLICRLANRLGYGLVDRKQVCTGVAGRLQVSTLTVHRLLDGSAPLAQRLTIGLRKVLPFLAEELAGLDARNGYVVEGYRAMAALPTSSNVMHVRIFHRCLHHRRKRFVHCDLALDAERIAEPECVEQICRLVERRRFAAVAGGVQADQSALPIGAGAPGLVVSIEGSSLKLAPMLSSEEAIAHVESHLRGASGIRRTDMPQSSLPPPEWARAGL